ncbi:mitochondrial ribosomal small subunit component [Trapelia coarctata]|nr:mitochondrial ribosomal small subunit component [Trapelia coarctata]
MLPTRALLARSVWKGPPRPISSHSRSFDVLLTKLMLIPRTNSLPIVRPVPGQKVVPIKTQARSATILPNFVGLKFQVHNGKVYHDVTITEDMVGHKLGEFSPTRKRFAYKQTKNR